MADFLLYLHTERKLAPVTIEGYRSTICGTIKAVSGVDLGKDFLLSQLLANFDKEHIRPRNRVPPWNLALVLRKLTQAPFEPIKEATLKHLTYKTVFLMALATGQHRSELHTIRKNVYHTHGWRSVTINPHPEFIAKTQLAGRTSYLNTVDIKALTTFITDDLSKDQSLYPV